MSAEITDSWNSFTRLSFEFNGRSACLVQPPTPLPGKPWIWRARFFGAFPSVDLALLRAGYHVAHVDTGGMFGAPPAMRIWDDFYAHIVARYDLAEYAVLEGFSRGGLFVYHWAALHPERVVCIYADAPVCDIRSWPGGLFSGPGSAPDWAICRGIYGISEADAARFDRNPIDILAPIAAARIPIIHVCGGADTVVPIQENTGILRARLQALGHDMELIVKPDCGHHPHSLEDPSPVVDFIHRAWTSGKNEQP